MRLHVILHLLLAVPAASFAGGWVHRGTKAPGRGMTRVGASAEEEKAARMKSIIAEEAMNPETMAETAARMKSMTPKVGSCAA